MYCSASNILMARVQAVLVVMFARLVATSVRSKSEIPRPMPLPGRLMLWLRPAGSAQAIRSNSFAALAFSSAAAPGIRKQWKL